MADFSISVPKLTIARFSGSCPLGSRPLGQGGHTAAQKTTDQAKQSLNFDYGATAVSGAAEGEQAVTGDVSQRDLSSLKQQPLLREHNTNTILPLKVDVPAGLASEQGFG